MPTTCSPSGFGPGVNGPLVLASEVPSPADRAVVEQLATRLRATPGVALVVPPNFNRADDAAVTIVIPTTSPQDVRTQHLVNDLRGRVVPAVIGTSGVRTYVGGVTAAAIDTSAQFAKRLYWVIAAVVLLSFLLLMAVFRSLAVPVKAAVMNLLSIGAAYGVIVAVFQWGWLGSIIGIGKTGPIDPWIPLMLFTILFGLSMDYEVFLLSRIRDEWRRTGDNATAVADGLATTGRVITAAAAIMVCVFGSFVLGDLRILKVFGLGLAVAVFVDATVVRSVLVPATMELLGRANWWFPSWLDRLVPRVSIEVAVAERRSAPAPIARHPSPFPSAGTDRARSATAPRRARPAPAAMPRGPGAGCHNGAVMSYVGLLIAAGLGVWVYLDAKKLRDRNITVASMPPALWGVLVFLIAIVFGILYLIMRPRAIKRANLGP